MNGQHAYFFIGLEQAFGFPITFVDEIEELGIWQVQTPDGEACLKRFRRYDEAETATEAALYLHRRGFAGTPNVILTKDGRPFVRTTISDPSWWLALFEFIPGEGGGPAPNLYAYKDLCDTNDTSFEAALVKAAQVLADFHEAIRGFRTWPVDRDVQFWIENRRRTEHLTTLLQGVLENEERREVREALEDCLGIYDPSLLRRSVSQAEQAAELYKSVIGQEKKQKGMRHCDTHAGNFLVGANGITLMDLAEVQAGPRVYRDLGCLTWALGGDNDEMTEALMAYHEIARLSRDEIELFPIINDPVDNWRKLLEGYLSGDWSEEWITPYYSGSVKPYERISNRLSLATEALRSSANNS